MTFSSFTHQNFVQNDAITSRELVSLQALIAYISYESGEQETNVTRRLHDRFNVGAITSLPAHQFEPAIRYLIDGLPGR